MGAIRKAQRKAQRRGFRFDVRDFIKVCEMKGAECQEAHDAAAAERDVHKAAGEVEEAERAALTAAQFQGAIEVLAELAEEFRTAVQLKAPKGSA